MNMILSHSLIEQGLKKRITISILNIYFYQYQGVYYFFSNKFNDICTDQTFNN